MFPKLFSALKLNENISLRNRIVMAPMGTNYADSEGCITGRNKLYYKTRALGGVGLIIVEAAHIDIRHRHRLKGISIYDDRFISGLSGLSDAIHEGGAVAFQQIVHGGRLTSSRVTGNRPIGCYPFPHPVSGETPHSLSLHEILEMENMFAEATERVKKAGFDGVEVHGGHGYLLAEFVSAYTNKRTDQYGGSLHNRMRFPLETVSRVRQRVGPDFLICFRLSADELIPGGLHLDESKILAKELEKAGVNLLHVSAGINEQPRTMARVIPFSDVAPGCFAHLAAAIKESVKIPVISVGRINYPDVAEKILVEGQADLVGLGRALIADPYWPLKAAEGRLKDIRKCVACNEGCIEALNRNEGGCCTVNPWEGREEEIEPFCMPSRLLKRKVVVVVGGGPAGMKAAEELARRGHAVTLFEKSEILGGQVSLASKPPGKEALMDIVTNLSHQLQKYNVSTNLNTEITERQIKTINPDAVILATGSLPVSTVEGISPASIITADKVLNGDINISQHTKFLVVGGGLAGLETAHYLAVLGKEVTVIEITDKLGANTGLMTMTVLVDKLNDLNVKFLMNTQLLQIGDNKTARVKTNDEIINIEKIDYVVAAVGNSPDDTLAKALMKSSIKVYSVGDCVLPRKIKDAIAEGAFTGAKVAEE